MSEFLFTIMLNVLIFVDERFPDNWDREWFYDIIPDPLWQAFCAFHKVDRVAVTIPEMPNK